MTIRHRRHLAVIGAGLAGAAVCTRFAARGWHVTLIDAQPAPAQGASGNHAASFHPLIARDNNRMVRLIRAGIESALTHWNALERAGFAFPWAHCGALQLSRAGAKQDLAGTLEALTPEPDYARVVSQLEASDIAGIALRSGGVLFGLGGWVQAPALVWAQLASCGERLTVQFGRSVARVLRTDSSGPAGEPAEWELLDASGQSIARAPVVVLAGGAGAALPYLFGQQVWPVEAVAGQITMIDAHDAAAACIAPRLPVHGEGYLLPCIDGRVVLGATYDRSGTQTMEAGHRLNLAQARRMLAAPWPGAAALDVSGRSALRAVARDRLPVIGALPDVRAIDARAVLRAGAQLAHLPRLPGVYAATAYGSRGLTWAALGAELLVSMVEGTAAPLAHELVDAIDPARFALREVRRSS